MAYILAMAILLGIAGWLGFSRIEFMVTIQSQRIRVRVGDLSARFLQNLDIICQENQLHSGWILGLRIGDRISLRFSPGIPKPVRQRCRNIWSLHRRR